MYIRPTDEEIEAWEKEVDDFKRENNLKFEENANITEICNSLNFRVLSLDLSDLADEIVERVDGAILVEDGYKAIAVNDKVAPQDARFIIAHELSHYINEKGNVEFAFRDILRPGTAKPPLENKMDYMAAAILVPRQKFKQLLSLFNIKGIKKLEDAAQVDLSFIESCSKLFNVSKDVILRRIIEVS